MVTFRLTSEQMFAGCTLLGLTTLMVALCFIEPGSSPWLPQCPFYELTGLYCPGCGTTRMLYFLVHGHPLLAFRENALAMLVFPAILYKLLRTFAGKTNGLNPQVSYRLGTALVVVVLVFGVARNLPFRAFRRLAPQSIAVLNAAR
jgi:Protein of unknown function (DUF2752)